MDSHDRSRLIVQYNSYSSLVLERGLIYEPVPNEQLEQCTVSELISLVKEVKELARTPS